MCRLVRPMSRLLRATLEISTPAGCEILLASFRIRGKLASGRLYYLRESWKHYDALSRTLSYSYCCLKLKGWVPMSLAESLERVYLGVMIVNVRINRGRNLVLSSSGILDWCEEPPGYTRRGGITSGPFD